MERRSEMDIARIVANYWTNFLLDPTTSRFNNGDTSKNGALAQMVAMKGKPQNYDPDAVDSFYGELVIALCDNQPSGIHVDYNPDYFLSELMDKTIGKTNWNSMSTFPCKTNMWINWTTGQISVSEGYCAPTIELEE